MKKNISLFAAAVVMFSVQSCSRSSEIDGNLLNDMDANQGGLIGKRALFRETMVGDTLTYYYTGYNLTSAIGTNDATLISYNGNAIDKISFNGFVGNNMVSYTQNFNYDNNGVINTVIENRNVTPAGQATAINIKSEITVKYKADKSIDSLIVKSGEVVAGQPFEYNAYARTAFTYTTNKNVTQLVKNQGVITAGQFVPSIVNTTYKFENFDDKKSPYSLIPFAYLLSQAIDETGNAYKFSTNNPKKMSFQTHLMPNPTVVTTANTYDPQDYLATSFNVFFQYKPF
ncbi:MULTISPECIES: hypothetical protein [Amniculibacterium]|uniref:hypothetical protein n=1 Tax=Amniculibacterium TaxID=2715289 RepID=UPI000F59FDD7|nr:MULTISPECIES: hypothetical protein [Amniculibacterium]